MRRPAVLGSGGSISPQWPTQPEGAAILMLFAICPKVLGRTSIHGAIHGALNVKQDGRNNFIGPFSSVFAVLVWQACKLILLVTILYHVSIFAISDLTWTSVETSTMKSPHFFPLALQDRSIRVIREVCHKRKRFLGSAGQENCPQNTGCIGEDGICCLCCLS